MASWAEMGTKRDFGHPDVLYFKANTTHKVRLLSNELPMQVFYHSCRDEAGGFIKVRCIGSRQGCRFCEVNNSEQYVKVTNSDRPYPFRSEFVGPVYVYELNQVKLLIGKVVWEKGIKPYGLRYEKNPSQGTLADRDLEVTRQDTNGQVSYLVMPLDPSQFLVQITPESMPDPANYVKWLEANAEKMAAAKLGVPSVAPAASATPVTQPAVPAMAQPAAVAQPAPQPASAQPAATPVAQPAVASTAAPAVATGRTPAQGDEHKQLLLQFSAVMAVKFDPKIVGNLVEKHGKGKQVEEMDNDTLRALIADYKMEAQVK